MSIADDWFQTRYGSMVLKDTDQSCTLWPIVNIVPNSVGKLNIVWPVLSGILFIS